MDPETKKRLLAEAGRRTLDFRRNYAPLESRFLDAIREARQDFEEAAWADDGTYIVFESFLWPHLLLAIETSDDTASLVKVFELIEEAAANDDRHQHDLIAITMIGSLFGAGVSGLIWPLMGPSSRLSWLECAMGRVTTSEQVAIDIEYRKRWLEGIEAMGGVSAISVEDAYRLRQSLIREFPEPPGYFRAYFRNWDVHAFLNADEYKRRLKTAIDQIGDRRDWYRWLSLSKDARESLLADPELQREQP